MELDANKNVVLMFMELVDAGRYDEIDTLVAEDFINHAGGGARGVEAWKAIFKAIVASFPDARYTVEDVIAEGDKVVVVDTMHGTHRASTFPALTGIEPRGRAVEWHFIHIFRIEDGRITEHWARRNDLEVLRSLSQEDGVLPSVPFATGAGRAR